MSSLQLVDSVALPVPPPHPAHLYAGLWGASMEGASFSTQVCIRTKKKL